MWAKVKRRCRAMLRFIRSLRNSRGEWRGEFRGEPQGDILGDPQGEQDDWGFSWMAWGLLSGKEPASSELSQGASLILLFIGLIKLLLIYSAALSVLTGSPVRPSHSSSILSEEKLLSLSSYSQTLVRVENLHFSASTVDGPGHECRSEPSPQQ